jgi:hypothetical protein
MGGLSVSLGRVVPAAAILAVALATTSCAGRTSVYEGAINEAEAGIAVLLEYSVEEISPLMLEHTTLDELPEDAITQAFVNDLRGFTNATPGPIQMRGVYDVVEAGDGSVPQRWSRQHDCLSPQLWNHHRTIF